MKYEQDWLMRQIKLMVDFTIKLMQTEKMSNIEEVEEWEYGKVTEEINEYLDNKDINQAENLLFKELDEKNVLYLKIGLEFYDRINGLRDEELERLNFSREEIQLGLKDLLQIYGVEYMPKE